MSISVKFDIFKDTASPSLSELRMNIRPKRIAAAIAPAMKICITDNFRAQPSNKMGFPSTGFWRDAVRSTNYRIEDDGAVVTVNKIGVRLRYFGTEGLPGGVLRPVNAKMLAIPAHPDAYGKSPRT